jgi:hypothetical protein
MATVSQAPRGSGARLVLPALVALPALVGAAALLARGWIPASDQAIEVLRVAEVGTRHMPLVGPWSRYGWHHPGPLLFWATAPGYRLLGPAGVGATVAVLNALAAAGAVVAARRIGGAGLALPVAVVAAVIAAAMGETLADPWNPRVGVLPLLAFLLCAWGASLGDGALLVGAVLAGSYAVQSHVGFLPVVAAGTVLCVASGLAARWRRLDRDARVEPRFSGRAALTAAAVGLLCWLGPLIDQADGSGNLAELARYAVSSPDPPVGWDVAFDVAGRQFGVPAPWMGAEGAAWTGYAATAPPWPALAVLAVAAAAGAIAWRRGNRARAWFVAYTALLMAASVVAMSRIADFLPPYLVLWAWPVAALVWIGGAWAAASVPPASRLNRLGAAIALAVVVAAVTVAAVRAGSEPVLAEERRAVEALGGAVRDRLDPGATYRLLINDPPFGPVGTGLAADLLLHGWDVRVPDDYISFEPRERVADDRPLPTLIVTVPTQERGQPPAGGAQYVDGYHMAGRDERVDVWLVPRWSAP